MEEEEEEEEEKKEQIVAHILIGFLLFQCCWV